MRVRNLGLSPVGRRPGRTARRVPVLVGLILSALLAGCNGASASPADSLAPTASLGSPAASPSAEASAEASVEPSDEPTDEPTAEPTPDETPGEATSSPASGGTGPCFGSAKTRAFISDFAQTVSWPVYCAILSKDWSLEHAEYRLANGGRLTIIYRRRSDSARLVLDEGSVCAETTPCVPGGSGLGPIPFSDRQADLSTISGGFAAVVDVTENPAWLLTGTGIGQKDFTAIAAKLRLLDQ